MNRQHHDNTTHAQRFNERRRVGFRGAVLAALASVLSVGAPAAGLTQAVNNAKGQTISVADSGTKKAPANSATVQTSGALQRLIASSGGDALVLRHPNGRNVRMGYVAHYRPRSSK